MLISDLLIRTIGDVDKEITILALLPASHITMFVQEINHDGQSVLKTRLSRNFDLLGQTRSNASHHRPHIFLRKISVNLIKQKIHKVLIVLGKERDGLFGQFVNVLRPPRRLTMAY